MKCVHIRTTNNRVWKLGINMKKRSVVLVMFQEPISSSWAFIYTFVMLIKEELSFTSRVWYIFKHLLGARCASVQPCKESAAGVFVCPVLRSRFHNTECDYTEVTLNVLNELQPTRLTERNVVSWLTATRNIDLCTLCPIEFRCIGSQSILDRTAERWRTTCCCKLTSKVLLSCSRPCGILPPKLAVLPPSRRQLRAGSISLKPIAPEAWLLAELDPCSSPVPRVLDGWDQRLVFQGAHQGQHRDMRLRYCSTSGTRHWGEPLCSRKGCSSRSVALARSRGSRVSMRSRKSFKTGEILTIKP